MLQNASSALAKLDNELIEELKAQDVKELQRITRRKSNELINNPTIILTIQGTLTPENIYVG